jgi:hypothetical protein
VGDVIGMGVQPLVMNADPKYESDQKDRHPNQEIVWPVRGGDEDRKRVGC